MMTYEYETNPFRVIRAAFSKLCEDAIYNETESDSAPRNPCPDYLAELRSAANAIVAAQSIEELAAIGWIARAAAIGAENMDTANRESE